MGRDAIPVLWVTGAPGVGKSTIGWGLFSRIAERGGNVAYVDIDQLGLIGPPPGGAASHEIKAGNLQRVIAAMRRRGVQQVIVSGVVDPKLGFESSFADEADVAFVRLRCDWEELRRRFLGRGSSAEMLAELFEVADDFDRSGLGVVLDTTVQHPDDTMNALLEQCVVRSSAVRPLPAEEALPGPVIVVTGATAVGKSTAAWSVLRHLWDSGVATAYVDLAQLGFVRPGPDPVLQTANLAALWCGYRQAGAEVLMVVTRDPGSVPAVAPTVVRLEADAATLADRVRRRADGESALLAGDELRGAPPAVQRRVTARAVSEADRLRSGTNQIVLDTTGQSPEETATALLDALVPHINVVRRICSTSSASGGVPVAMRWTK